MVNKQLTALFYGWTATLILIIFMSLIIALLLRFTPFNEPTLSWTTLGAGLLALFVGGIVAGIKGKQKGWLIGIMTGIGFTCLIFLIQYLGYKQSFSLQQSLYHLGFIFAALIGGVIGVNVVGVPDE